METRPINFSTSSRSTSFLIKNILNLSGEQCATSTLKQPPAEQAPRQSPLVEPESRQSACEICQHSEQVVDLRIKRKWAANEERAASEAAKTKEAHEKRHRTRTMFSDWQLASLEWRFAKNKYLTASDRTRIAKMLQLNQLQVKTWFQVSRLLLLA